MLNVYIYETLFYVSRLKMMYKAIITILFLTLLEVILSYFLDQFSIKGIPVFINSMHKFIIISIIYPFYVLLNEVINLKGSFLFKRWRNREQSDNKTT